MESPSTPDPRLAELRQELGEIHIASRGGATGVAELTVEVPCGEIGRIAALLRTRFRYSFLADLCAADYPLRTPRFEVIYHLYSFRENRRLRVKLKCDDGDLVPSVAAVWGGAGWLEREAHELFGIAFSGRAAPRPLLLWDGFDGHPMRKDFPLAGITTGAGVDPDLPPRPPRPPLLPSPSPLPEPRD
jgi:NADH-quinone oxidoreductase subunit C